MAVGITEVRRQHVAARVDGDRVRADLAVVIRVRRAVGLRITQQPVVEVSDHDPVGTGGKAAEEICAARVGGRRRHGHVIRGAEDAIRAGCDEVDRHAGDAALVRAGLVHAVAVGIVEDQVTDGDALALIPEVCVEVGLVGREGDRAVRVRAAGLRQAGQYARGIRHTHAEGAGAHAREQVDARRVGRRTADHAVVGGPALAVGARREQIERDAADADLAGILHAVAVRIAPHAITDGLVAGVAEVRLQVVLTCRQGDRPVGIRAADQRQPPRQRRVVDTHAVDANAHTGEQVIAVRVRDLRGNDCIVGAAHTVLAGQRECHRHAAQARLTGLANAVAVVVVYQTVSPMVPSGVCRTLVSSTAS